MKCYLLFLFFCSLSVNIRAEDATVSVDKSVWDNIYNAAIIVCACTAKPIPTVPPQVCSNRTRFDSLSVVEVNAAIILCENINAVNIKLTGPPKRNDGTVEPGSGDGTVKPGTNGTVEPGSGDGTVKPGTNGTVEPGSGDGTVKPGTNGTVKPETNATVKPETNARGTPGSNRTPGSNSGHDAAAGHQVTNKPEPTKVAIHVVVIGVFCAFAAGVLVAIGCKYAYDRYRKRSYVLPPEQGMQM